MLKASLMNFLKSGFSLFQTSETSLMFLYSTVWYPHKMRLHCACFDASIEVGTVGMYFVGSRRVSWPNSRATAICIRTILWSPWHQDPVGRAKIFLKVETRGGNAAVSNTACVPLTALTFNKIMGGGAIYMKFISFWNKRNMQVCKWSYWFTVWRSNHGMSVLRSKQAGLKLFHQRILLLYICSKI